jgi:hypothetical protein
MRWRRRLRARRLYLGPAEREELAHSGFLQRAEGPLEVVLYFDDGRPDYAVAMPPRLDRRVRRFLFDAMDAIDPLLFEDANAGPPPPARRTT